MIKKVKAEPERTRISDYTKITTLDDDHRFSVDLLDIPTHSVTFVDLSKIISKDIDDANNYRLVQDFKDSTKETYKITSVLYSEKNITTEIYDGFSIRVNEQTTALIPNGWQLLNNNTPDNIKIKLSFNNTDYLPLYNGTAYDNYGLIGLDRDTLWGYPMMFKYSASLNAWLVYKYPESYTFKYYTVESVPSGAGIVLCLLKESDVRPLDDTLKLMATILGSTLPQINSTTLTRLGNETPLNTRANGQVGGNGIIEVEGLDASSIAFYFNTSKDIDYYTSGIFNSTSSNDAQLNKNDVTGQHVRFTYAPSITSTNTKIGNQLLANRYGLYGGYII